MKLFALVSSVLIRYRPGANAGPYSRGLRCCAQLHQIHCVTAEHEGPTLLRWIAGSPVLGADRSTL